MNALLYVGGVVLLLAGFLVATWLVARRDKPIKSFPALLVILGAVLLAGVCCSIAAADIRVLYWWLLGLAGAAVFFHVLFGLASFVAGSLHRKK
jgi:uncharacterized membrane protein